ncbi:DUF7344 domain-containing protein [Natronobacterium haloterrestre]|nr:hypothetical protein [Halobiforma haloterrestris]
MALEYMPTHPDRTWRQSPGARTGSNRANAAPRSPGGHALSRGTLERVLENDRRRATLETLLEAGESLSLGTLVGRLADAEGDATTVSTVHERRQRVHVSLCRTHLPLLESHGLVAYDRERGLVSPGDRLSAVKTKLEAALEATDGR